VNARLQLMFLLSILWPDSPSFTMMNMARLTDSAQELMNRNILLLDGGLGTTLEDEHGMKFSSEETPLWSSHLLISSPETLLKVQTDFAKAGADVILTATYQASFDGMAKTPAISHWDHKQKQNALTSAVSISKAAVDSNGLPGLVALSLGAYGATLIPSQEYSGIYGECDLLSFHRSRLQAFMEDESWKNVDIVAFETLPRLDEIKVAREVMSGHDSVKPFWISCVFRKDDNLPDGSSIEQVVKAMLEKDETVPPYAIGINCTKVHKISALIRKFEEAADGLGLALPRIVIYPDGAGGLIYDTALQKWVGDGSEDAPWDEQLFDIVKEVVGRGRWAGLIVGGCCKTTPGHIVKLRKRLDEWDYLV
jgi:homocysteine S-methyltransferase